MNAIIVTDGFTLNPGDLSWNELKQFGELQIFDRSSAQETKERCQYASVIITNKTPITKEIIAAAANLKLIAVTATGYNIVDIDAATERNIPVCNVPGYGTDSVAQHTFALLLELTNHVGKNSKSVSDGDWGRSRDFCYTKGKLIEIAGKTLGIIGWGRIGQKVAEIATAFGMRVIYSSKSAPASDPNVSLEKLFSESDFVSLHCPLRPDNHAFVNKQLLSLMKPTAFLINTARGQLVHEVDLAEILVRQKIAGAALDVLSAEPPPVDHPLIRLENCLITPHNAWLSFEARQRIMNVTIENVRSALRGKPQNLVNLVRS